MFYLRLAMAWGCSVRELLARVTSAEITELMAYEQQEPFGWPMDNHRTAQLCAVVANYSGRTRKQLQVQDFLPKVRRDMSVDEMIANLKASWGG